MTPSILIVGATGNTGRAVTETLPKLLKSSNALSDHRIIAFTRSAASSVAQQLAKLPGVEVVEQNWVEITSDWLREHEVVRAYIASHRTESFCRRIDFPCGRPQRWSQICCANLDYCCEHPPGLQSLLPVCTSGN